LNRKNTKTTMLLLPFSNKLKTLSWTACLIMIYLASCTPAPSGDTGTEEKSTSVHLRIEEGEDGSFLMIYRENEEEPIVTQHARPDHRPYLHPIEAPDGKGILTEYSPGHHKHQTGLYWGFTRVNGRDYFHHPEGDYWERISLEIKEAKGKEVRWQTVYHLLDEAGEPIMKETQNWKAVVKGEQYFLSLEWIGEAIEDITIGEYDYGGLFLRMPWREGINGEVVNAARQRNEQAEGQRAMWVDVGMQVEGREDLAHIAIFDHPDNKGFPQPWRVDGQLGVGPVRARMGDWGIEKGRKEIIQHQIVAYTGELDDLELTETWQEYSGVDGTYSTASLWGIAQKAGLGAEFLTPEKAVAKMTLKDGFKVNSWASEPMITQPMAFCWDDKGRMWVAENRDYESRSTGFSNSGDSRIVILEDTDGDGQADRRKIFLEGVPFPSGIAVGFGGLYLAAPPHLIFIPDENEDDVGDMGNAEILLTGWGIRDRHETINSLHWGPDGWLYGLEGFATPSVIRKPAGNEKMYRHKDPFPQDLLEAKGIEINGGVWRYHPTKEMFEVVAHGFSNPWGIDYDAKGQLFISACVIPHMFHIIPGGIYHRQGGTHFNPYAYSDIRTIVDHRHRSAHGGARIYLSDAFPEEYQGRLFMANIHEHAVLSDILEPKGSGFVARHGDDFLLANNAQWIGFSMEIGPEGGLYVLDWHDADICGKDVYHKETGRIYRIMPERTLAKDWEGRYDDLGKMKDLKLVQMQLKRSEWHARRARTLLQYRASEGQIDADAITRLRDIFRNEQNLDWRLRAMWTLHAIDGFEEHDLMIALQDDDPYIRAWAVQLLTEDMDASAEALETFAQLARRDPSPVVRMYLAAALQRIDLQDRWDIAEQLVQHEADRDDHNIPHMLWFGIEPLLEEDPNRALALVSKSEIPMTTRYMARKAVDIDELFTLVAWVEKRSPAQQDLLEGMLAGLEGRTDVEAPSNWQPVYTKLQKDRDISQLATSIAQQFGDAEAVQQFLAIIENKQAKLEERKDAIRGLAAREVKELEEVLPELLQDEALRLDAIQAVAAYDSDTLGKILMANYDHYTSVERAEVIQTMASRSRYGWMLVGGLREEKIAKSDIPAYLARQLRRVVGNGFVEIWGPIDQRTQDQEAAMARYRALLTAENLSKADLSNGRLVYTRTCGACHQMYDEGGKLGPDITGSNRTDLDYLLNNILYPSEEIQGDYKMVVITTQQGRTYMGNIAAESNRQLTLTTVGQEAVTINQNEIQSLETTEKSMMPEGILETLSEQEVIDLVGYLQSKEQVPLSVEVQ